MAIRFRKSVKLFPGVKVNLNKKSTSVTFGTKGLHKTFSSTGKTTTSVGLPGTGLSSVNVKSAKKEKEREVAPLPQNLVYHTYNNKIYGLLSIFLGTIGAHKFYSKQFKQGLLYLFFSFTLIPSILGIVDGIKHLKKAKFEETTTIVI